MFEFNLIKNRLGEIINEEYLNELLNSDTQINLYWGTAPTGKIHIGYIVPLIKISELLLSEKFKITILFADVHAHLDNMKSGFDVIQHRTNYYMILIKIVIEYLLNNCNPNNLFFKKGSEFQYSKEYVSNLYKIISKISINEAKKAGAQVVKQDKNPTVGSIVYPTMQALDEIALECDGELGGIDQRKIMTHSIDTLGKIGYNKKRFYMMNKLIPALNTKPIDLQSGQKMSASSSNLIKLDLLDSKDDIKTKIMKCYCKEGELNCGLIIFVQEVIYPFMHILNITGREINFIIDNINYNDINRFNEDFSQSKIHPNGFKQSLVDLIDQYIIGPIRDKFMSNNFNIDTLNSAYIN
jgi:tyrosyl-tRNA synthetase